MAIWNPVEPKAPTSAEATRKGVGVLLNLPGEGLIVPGPSEIC